MTRWLKKLVSAIAEGMGTFKPIGRAVVGIKPPLMVLMMDGSLDRYGLCA